MTELLDLNIMKKLRAARRRTFRLMLLERYGDASAAFDTALARHADPDLLASASEAALIPGARVLAASSLLAVCAHLAGESTLPAAEPPPDGGSVEACWDAYVTDTVGAATSGSDPVALARLVLALADRPHRDFVTAMLTSLRAVGANRAQMVSWAGMIAMMMCACLLTGLLALLVVLPLLGHATWHVYRRIIVPA